MSRSIWSRSSDLMSMIGVVLSPNTGARMATSSLEARAADDPPSLPLFFIRRIGGIGLIVLIADSR